MGNNVLYANKKTNISLLNTFKVMRKIILMIMPFIIMAGLSNIARAQNGTHSITNAGAKLVSAITITNQALLNFGTMSVPNADADVSISTANVISSNNQSSITLIPGTATNAHYKVTGDRDLTYIITLPSSVTISSGTSNNMEITNFIALTKSNPGPVGTNGKLSTAGEDEFDVGATLKVKGSQPAGTYTGSLDVAVTYN